MSSVLSTKLRDLANQLNKNTSTETIINVKSSLLIIANDLEKAHAPFLLHDDLNDILQMDEKTYMLKEDMKNVVEWIDTALRYSTCHPAIKSVGLTNASWVASFTAIPKDSYQPPFNLKCAFNQKDLEIIFDSIPKQYKDDYGNYSEIDVAKWFISYKTDSKNQNKKLFDVIFEQLKIFGCWVTLKDESNLEEAVEFYEIYKEYIDINMVDFSDGNTLLHEAAIMNRAAVLNWLLSFKNIKTNIVNFKGRTPMDEAKESGHWNIVSSLTFASLGDKMRTKANNEISKLKRVEGMIKQFFRFYKISNTNSTEYKSMKKMCQSIKTLIKKRLPLSDSMLSICFDFELQQNNNNPLKCSIWKTLRNTLTKCLQIPLNRRNWLWFKQYIFGLSLWYQNVPQNNEKKDEYKIYKRPMYDSDEEKQNIETKGSSTKLLYHLLIEMVNKQLQSQREYLKPYIKSLNNDDMKENIESWDKMKNCKEFIVTDNCEGLRQDGCLDSKSNKELLSNPILPDFTDDELVKLSAKVKEFNAHHHYDIHGYLSKLILVAHSLNEKFHETMRLIFDIDKSSSNSNDGLMYHAGPVKCLLRSQAKTETDYSSASYPRSAKIIDFIRCCCVYDSPKNLMNGIEKFVETINRTKSKTTISCGCGKDFQYSKMHTINIPNGKYIYCNYCANILETKSDYIYHCVECKKYLCEECAAIKLNPPLKKILRLKNMFLENKRANNGKWDLYKYADIKISALMEYDDKSMIVEVQFLLNFMLRAKGLGHGLYEIERNKDFVFSVNEIMNMGSNNINEAVRSAIVTNNETELATLILNNAPLNLTHLDENKKSLVHICCENGNKKVLRLLLHTVEADGTNNELNKLINQKDGEFGFAPIRHCVAQRNPELLAMLLKFDGLNVNIVDNENDTPFLSILESQSGDYAKHEWSKKEQMFKLLVNDKRVADGWHIQNKSNRNVFVAACEKGGDVKFVKTLWKSKLFKINDVDDFGYTVLMRTIQNRSVNIVKYLLTIPGINVNMKDHDGDTAMDIAIQYGKDLAKEMMSMLYKRKDFKQKVGKRNKFTLAVDTNDIELVQFVLKLWPNININKPDYGDSSRSAVQTACCKTKGTNVMLKYILRLPGIKVDLVDNDGYSPWLTAIRYENLECAKILWQRKDINFKRKQDGKNALEIAEDEMVDKEVIQWLQSVNFDSVDDCGDNVNMTDDEKQKRKIAEMKRKKMAEKMRKRRQNK